MQTKEEKREKNRESARKSYRKNRKKRLLYQKNRRERIKNNPILKEKLKENFKRYKYSIKGMYCILKNRSKYLNFKFNISLEDFEKWYKNQDKKCSYCLLKLEEINKIQDIFKKWKNGLKKIGIDRKDNSKGYELNNMVFCCFPCNYIKKNIFSFEEMKKIGKIIHKKYEKTQMQDLPQAVQASGISHMAQAQDTSQGLQDGVRA